MDDVESKFELLTEVHEMYFICIVCNDANFMIVFICIHRT